MELKQLEYLIAAVESRSLNKAAERLYTSQPNISKVLKSFEEELSIKVLERTSKGVYLTQEGAQIYDYAKSILKTARTIDKIAEHAGYAHLKVAACADHSLTRKLADFYMDTRAQAVHIELFSDTVEAVVSHVQSFGSDIGLIYYATHQAHAFEQMLSKKHLAFHPLKDCKLCLYVGPEHPYYDMTGIPYEHLTNQKYVQGKSDFFSLLDNIGAFSNGRVTHHQMRHIVHTNSDDAFMTMLKHTDLCALGIDLDGAAYEDVGIHKIPIDDSKQCLTLGYVTRKGHGTNWQEDMFIGYCRELLQES